MKLVSLLVLSAMSMFLFGCEVPGTTEEKNETYITAQDGSVIVIDGEGNTIESGDDVKNEPKKHSEGEQIYSKNKDAK